MNTQAPIVIDHTALITPKGDIFFVVCSPRLVQQMAYMAYGKSWVQLQSEGWKSEPVHVQLRSETTEVKP